MKLTAIILIVSFAVFMIFYGGYYLFWPSLKGEEVVRKHNLPHPTVIAHRGASFVAPESTVPAYTIAIDQGVDYVEADLQMTRDGKVVVFHDQTLQRTTNIEEVFPGRQNEELGNFTYEELKELDVGSWFNVAYPGFASEEYRGLTILTLEELIDIASRAEQPPGLILELKYSDKYPEIEEKVVNILEKKNWLDSSGERVTDYAGTIFFTFNRETLKTLKQLRPNIPRLLLVSDKVISRRGWGRLLEFAEDTADGLGVKGFVAWPWHIARAHDRGIFVFTYVINKGWQMKIMAQFKADGYITDSTEAVLKFMDRFNLISTAVD